jgi:hypothetical protein
MRIDAAASPQAAYDRQDAKQDWNSARWMGHGWMNKIPVWKLRGSD